MNIVLPTLGTVVAASAAYGLVTLIRNHRASASVSSLLGLINDKYGTFDAFAYYDSIWAICRKNHILIPGNLVYDDVAQLAIASYERAVDYAPLSPHDKDRLRQNVSTFRAKIALARPRRPYKMNEAMLQHEHILD